MAKTILTVLLIVLVNVLVGCNDVDNSSARLMLVRNKTSFGTIPVVKIADTGETDIVEKIAANRQGYQQGLEMLVGYYSKEGNYMKMRWAQKELAQLNGISQYNYIVEAGLAGPDLKASDVIREADNMYFDAMAMEDRARALLVIVDENLLRQALDKYNRLIRSYPSSDKIDDAAYRAGGIYEHFKDYSIAVLYYQRAYQWEPQTEYPAMFKTAYILDRMLHHRAEALELYKQAVRDEGLAFNYRTFAEERIEELSSGGEEIK